MEIIETTTLVLKRKINLLFLDVVTKELQKKFPKVTNSFQTETSILTTIFVGAREKSTTKNYLGYFSKWSKWARQYPEALVLPAKEIYSYILVKPSSIQLFF